MLDDFAVVQHDDVVGPAQELDVVRAQDARLVSEQAHDALLKQVLGNVRVDGSERIIEQIDAFIL